MIGLTGPPGVGKSTLVSALVRAWRARGRTVGVIAVDPSSRRTGGALLGDRTRIDVDPDDQGVFVRSLAARDRLGGLADLAAAAMVLMRALYDVVLVETVGVGQSETEIAEIADTVVFAVQPGSGDSLQFMKAGIVEIPDIALVTKADLGAASPSGRSATSRVPSASFREGAAGCRRSCWCRPRPGRGSKPRSTRSRTIRRSSLPISRARRAARGEAWLERWVREEFGRRGLARLGHGWSTARDRRFDGSPNRERRCRRVRDPTRRSLPCRWSPCRLEPAVPPLAEPWRWRVQSPLSVEVAALR